MGLFHRHAYDEKVVFYVIIFTYMFEIMNTKKGICFYYIT
jgi:hypothetical protein